MAHSCARTQTITHKAGKGTMAFSSSPALKTYITLAHPAAARTHARALAGTHASMVCARLHVQAGSCSARGPVARVHAASPAGATPQADAHTLSCGPPTQGTAAAGSTLGRRARHAAAGSAAAQGLLHQARTPGLLHPHHCNRRPAAAAGRCSPSAAAAAAEGSALLLRASSLAGMYAPPRAPAAQVRWRPSKFQVACEPVPVPTRTRVRVCVYFKHQLWYTKRACAVHLLSGCWLNCMSDWSRQGAPACLLTMRITRQCWCLQRHAGKGGAQATAGSAASRCVTVRDADEEEASGSSEAWAAHGTTEEEEGRCRGSLRTCCSEEELGYTG